MTSLSLDIKQVVSDMLQASAKFLLKGGEKATAYAAHEYSNFILDLEHVQTMAENKEINEEEAKYLVMQHKLSMQAVLLCVEGLGIIAVQNAINAAIEVLNLALKAALGSVKFL